MSGRFQLQIGPLPRAGSLHFMQPAPGRAGYLDKQDQGRAMELRHVTHYFRVLRERSSM
jgi:hypothetical protein